MKNSKAMLAAIALVLALAVPGVRVFAQDNPCKADADKFCKDMKGKDRMACMKSHEADLSDACKAKMAAHKDKGTDSHPCAADMDKFCKDMKGKNLMACMKSHEADLSDACKAKIAKVKENNPCAADIEKFCKDVKPGKGAIIACLKQHEADLSAECKAKGLEVKKAVDNFKEACQADLDKFCKDMKPGEGQLIKCLKDHEKDLSDTCKAKIAEAKQGRRGRMAGRKGSDAAQPSAPVTTPAPAAPASPAAPADVPATAPAPQTK